MDKATMLELARTAGALDGAADLQRTFELAALLSQQVRAAVESEAEAGGWFSEYEEASSQDRSAYMDFLRERVRYWCDESLCFQAEWGRDDRLLPDQLMDAWQHYESEGYACIEDCLAARLSDKLQDQMEETFRRCITSDLEQASDEVKMGWRASGNPLWEDLESTGFRGVDMNIDGLLQRSSFDLTLCFATEKERNRDYGSILQAYGSCSAAPEFSDQQGMDNALTYLLHQQGYTARELYGQILLDQPSNSPFMRSVEQELHENGASAMSELVALIRVPGGQACPLLRALDHAQGTPSHIALGESTTVGLFNEWIGCGSMLGIELEKPSVFPTNLISHFDIEGAEHGGCYSVHEVYGLCSDQWKDTLRFTDEPPSLHEEDMAETLAYARDASRTGHPGVCLENEGRDARDASAQLSGPDAPPASCPER